MSIVKMNGSRVRLAALGAIACAAVVAAVVIGMRSSAAGDAAEALTPEVVQAVEQANAEALSVSPSLPAEPNVPAFSNAAQPLKPGGR